MDTMCTQKPLGELAAAAAFASVNVRLLAAAHSGKHATYSVALLRKRAGFKYGPVRLHAVHVIIYVALFAAAAIADSASLRSLARAFG